MIPFPPFLQKWGLSILLIAAVAGLSAGFWLYISGLNANLRDAEVRVSQLESEIAGYAEQAREDAETISGLNARLDLEHSLAQTRLDTETDRRLAAESRNRNFAGALDALRSSLSDAGCVCGLGPDLSDRMRDAREAREAERVARQRAN